MGKLRPIKVLPRDVVEADNTAGALEIVSPMPNDA